MKKTRYLLIFIVIFFMVALIVNPAKYINSVLNGLQLYAFNVLPCLFPFFFFSRLLNHLGLSEMMAKYTYKPIKKIYNTPPISAYILAMSMLSGYPVGAKLLSEFYEEKLIKQEDIIPISAFCSTSGPLFVVGTVGAALFHNQSYGYIILICHYIATLLNGLIYTSRKNEYIPIQLPPIEHKNILSDSMTSSISAILVVGAYIAIFNMIADVLVDVGLINILAKGLSYPLSWLRLPKELSKPIIFSLIEITKGCKVLSCTNIPPLFLLPTACATISIGGLSITLQSLTFLSKCNVKASKFILTKVTQSILSFCICFIVCYFIF